MITNVLNVINRKQENPLDLFEQMDSEKKKRITKKKRNYKRARIIKHNGSCGEPSLPTSRRNIIYRKTEILLDIFEQMERGKKFHKEGVVINEQVFLKASEERK